MELLTKIAIDGEVKHLYRHDVESFISAPGSVFGMRMAS
jgi:hypothetical protein